MFPEEFRRDPLVTSDNGEKIRADQFYADQIQKAGNVILGMNSNLPPAAIFMRARPGLGKIGTVGETIMRDLPFVEEKFWNLRVREIAHIFRLDLSKPQVKMALGEITFPIIRPMEGDPTNYSVLLTKNGMLKLDENGELSADKDEPDRPSNEKPYWTERVWSLGIALAARALGLDLEHPVLDDPRRLVCAEPMESNDLFRWMPMAVSTLIGTSIWRALSQ